jgi:hypothetical protein
VHIRPLLSTVQRSFRTPRYPSKSPPCRTWQGGRSSRCAQPGRVVHFQTLMARKVFNQEFIVDERYNVTKELGQGAYGIVW